MKRAQLIIKTLFDYFFALIGGIIAFPIILIVALIVKINSPEDSPFFSQIRVGYRGEQFLIWKIRSMTNEKDENGELLPDEYRLKGWGKVIRKLSVDELPQIYAIITHKMSWIGPRPLLPSEMKVMTVEEQVERQSMLPGITGWEAVNEEKSDSRREMAEFDLEYVRNWSIIFDLKILLMTVKKIFLADRSDEEHRAPKLNESEIIDKSSL